jgi:hypothetical protein
MRPITVGVDVARPANEAFAFVADVENNPRWQRGMRVCRWTSPPPHGIGATYDQTARFLGRDIASSFRVVEHLPGRRIKLVSTAGPFPIVETRSVQPLGEGRAHVSAIVEGDASGFFRLAAPILRRLVARSVRADYARLRRLLESGG